MEVRDPGLRPGVEERDEGSGEGIERADITRLPPITHGTGQREIFEDRLAAMFFRDDMIHLMGRGGKVLGHQAVFTTVVGPCDDLPAQVG